MMGPRRGELWNIHNKLFSVVTVLLLLLALLTPPAAGKTNPADVLALQQLSKQWGSALQWSGQDPCAGNWLGVACDSTKTNVTRLLLSSMAISGTIPPAIGQLVNLESLELSYNPELGGPLPTQLGLLTNLSFLSLQSCSFTGQIPESLKNLTQLKFLALNGNQLSGPIPSSLGSLPSMWWFDLSSNNLSGPLPVSSVDGFGLDTMQSILHIHLNNNSFSGPIPSELGTSPSLRNLVHLLLDSNSLSGQIPGSLGSLPSLVIMSLYNNKLTGSLPTTVHWTNKHLQQLNVANNNLTGVLPDLSVLPVLTLIDFSNNPLADQPIPSWLTTLPLQSIVMQQAGLSGSIPSTIFDMPSLQALNLGQNKLNGTLTFPPVLGPNLTDVELEQNDIAGFVASAGLNLSSLTTLLLGGNPICSNNFYNLPPAQCSLAKNGTLGWVLPYTCASTTCSGAQKLNPKVCSCAIPMIILLELRSPSFRIVTPTMVLLLETGLADGLHLNISQVSVQSAIFTDNARRVNCSIFFFPPNATQDQLSQSDQTKISSSLAEQNVRVDPMFVPYRLITAPALPLNLPGKSDLGVKVLVGIIVPVVVLAIVIAAVTMYAVIQKRRADRMRSLSNPFASWGSGRGKGTGEAPKLKGARWFSFAELKEATDDFNESNEIGAGGYGKVNQACWNDGSAYELRGNSPPCMVTMNHLVYRATLPSGDVVAVKRAQESSMQGAAEFKNEIELLSRVHHKNLVGLVGFCFEHSEQMLVYEFMSLGTVQQHLRGKSKQMMDWRIRMTIALGSARGLAYLHDLANPPIIHHDVKTTNILLDNDMVAKVADFGISKQAGNDMSSVVKGTVGYMDPEYYMTQLLTASSDVYSFGVVLLELITGRHPIEYGKFIVRELKLALDTGGLPALESMLDPYIGKYSIEDLEKYLDLALSCVDDKAVDRPTMMAIVQTLESLVGPTGSAPIASTAPAPAMRNEDLYSRIEKLGGGSDHSNNFQYSGDKVPPVIEPL